MSTEPSMIVKKLVIGTHHDKFSVHKILGYSALIHYAVRYANFWIFGNMGFSGNATDLVFIAGHLVLSLSSFLFPIREKRNASNQIIWRELQLHNIVFTFRSCLIFAIMTLFPSTSPAIRFPAVMATHCMADIVTHYVGQGTTTRDMKWDDNLIPIKMKWAFDKFYAVSQIQAIVALVFSRNPKEYSLMIMFSIQMAVFLMTLRLKGIISNDMFHIVYSACLWSAFTIVKNETKLTMNIAWLFYFLRCILGINKYISWSVCFGVVAYLSHYHHENTWVGGGGGGA